MNTIGNNTKFYTYKFTKLLLFDALDMQKTVSLLLKDKTVK